MHHRKLKSLNALLREFSERSNESADFTKAIRKAFIQWNEVMSQFGENINTISADIQNKVNAVDVIFFDFDGVMSDNKVYTDQNGNESFCCDRADGIGIKQLKGMGKQAYILSTEKNPVVNKRSEKLKIICFSGCHDKTIFIEQWMEENNISPKQVTLVGNDINDLGAMKGVGLTPCPMDSHESVLKAVDIVIPKDRVNKIVRSVADVFSANRVDLLEGMPA